MVDNEPEVDVDAVLQELQEMNTVEQNRDSPRELRGIEDVSNMGITFNPLDDSTNEQAELMQKICGEAVKSDNIFDGLNEALRVGEDQ